MVCKALAQLLQQIGAVVARIVHQTQLVDKFTTPAAAPMGCAEYVQPCPMGPNSSVPFSSTSHTPFDTMEPDSGA